MPGWTSSSSPSSSSSSFATLLILEAEISESHSSVSGVTALLFRVQAISAPVWLTTKHWVVVDMVEVVAAVDSQNSLPTRDRLVGGWDQVLTD